MNNLYPVISVVFLHHPLIVLFLLIVFLVSAMILLYRISDNYFGKCPQCQKHSVTKKKRYSGCDASFPETQYWFIERGCRSCEWEEETRTTLEPR
jgi:hypothetical protein